MNKHYWSEHDGPQPTPAEELKARGLRSLLGILAAMALVSALFLVASFAHAQTATFTATRDATVNTTFRLAWNVPGAATCTAGDVPPGWSGSVPTSGTRTLTSVGVKMTLTLDCRAADGKGSLRLTWTPPTTNTDGTSLTNLGGYRIHYSPGTPTLHLTVDLKVPAATAYDVRDLDAGTYHVALSALTTSCFDTPVPVTCRTSAQSNIASKAVAATPGAALPQLSVELDPFPAPSPPTELSVTDVPTAFEIKKNSIGVLVATRIGLVPIGTKCDATRQQKLGTITYSLIPRAAVDMVNWPTNVKLADVWARCG